MLQNTIVVNNNSVTVANAQRPFSNNFLFNRAIKTVRTRNGRDAYVVSVTCAADSNEPGRVYFCTYTAKGTLLECLC